MEEDRLCRRLAGLRSRCSSAFAPWIANAAGADGSWTWCWAPARLQAAWWGRTWHVATWGTDTWNCPQWSGYTFRTIDSAVRCAWGGDTVYVHNGTYGPVSISNKWQNDDILITNAPGENPVIDGWSSVGDYQAIFSIWNVEPHRRPGPDHPEHRGA